MYLSSAQDRNLVPHCWMQGTHYAPKQTGLVDFASELVAREAEVQLPLQSYFAYLLRISETFGMTTR